MEKKLVYISNFLLSYIVVGKPINNIVSTMFPQYTWVFNFILFVPLIIIALFRNGVKTVDTKVNTSFWVFFGLYYLMCFYYEFVDQRLPIDTLLSVPAPMMFSVKFLYLVALLFLARYFYYLLNVRLFIFISFAICTIPSLLYIQLMGVEVLQLYSNDSFESQFVGLLTLGYSNSILLILSALFYDRLYPKNKKINYILLCLIVIAALYILVVCTKRGPMFWSAVSIMIAYYFKSTKALRWLFMVFVFVGVLYIFGEHLLSLVETFAPTSAMRMKAAIYEGDTASRLDGDGGNNIYLLSLAQFMDSPIFGSYYRLISPGFNGIYPHNLFLEILITVGSVGFIPFICLLLSLVKRVRDLFRYGTYNDKDLAVLCLFLYTFTTLMTTGSLLLNNTFWLAFILIIIICNRNEDSIYSISGGNCV